MKSTNFLRTWAVVYLCFVALVMAACGAIEPSPTAPSPTPAPAPAPSPGPSPAPSNGPGRLEVTVTPNPVPWSGQPITDAAGCANVPNTWFYTQTLTNTGGNTITVSDRTNFFNDREVSKSSNLGIVLAPGASHNVTTRWCSSASGSHTAQTNWAGSDNSSNERLSVNGPRVTLLAK